MKWIKVLLPLIILVVGFGAMKSVTALGEQDDNADEIDTRPSVSVATIKPEAFAIELEAFGELMPLESTNLAAQVSGEVINWNPAFVAGGIVKRGETLFEIESIAYEAALLQAEASLLSAQAALIQEKALAEVAKREAETLPSVKVTDLYLRKPQILSAEAALKAAQAQLKIAKRDLANCKVVAPYNALVVSRSIGKGDFLTTGTPAALLYNVEIGEILFPVARFDQAFLPENLTGVEADISIINRSDDIKLRSGTIMRDTGVYDANTRMINLVVRIEDPYALIANESALKFGAYLKVSFTGKTLDNLYKVPQEMINKRLLWILDSEDKLVSKPVEVVRELGTYFLIRADIKHNDRVVKTLPEYPQNGMAVNVLEVSESLVAKQ